VIDHRRHAGATARRIAPAVAAACVAIALAGGCSMTAHHASKAPTGLLGFTWGDDAAEAGRAAGLALSRWDPWIDPAFEAAIDLDTPRQVLGVEGLIRLVRIGAKQLDGVQVSYRACARDDARRRTLRDGLRRELHVKSPDVEVPYEIWSDGSLVHLASDPADDTCTLTVAGPRFGKAFAAALLRGGAANLGGSIGPK
jgi:hypothetical protein